MNLYILKMFGISLGLTLLLELPVGLCMGLRQKKYMLLMVLVNILTNPPAVLLCWLGISEPFVEFIVFMTEAMIFKWFSLDSKWEIPHPVLLSVAANGFSWVMGILLQYWRIV